MRHPPSLPLAALLAALAARCSDPTPSTPDGDPPRDVPATSDATPDDAPDATPEDARQPDADASALDVTSDAGDASALDVTSDVGDASALDVTSDVGDASAPDTNDAGAPDTGDAGAPDTGDAAAPDVAPDAPRCEPGSCSGRGACADVAGATRCTCDVGYAGARCEACDATGGYFSDGRGGCTNDPCTPNPCGELNRTACVADGMRATCRCAPGTHEAGGACVPDAACTPTSCNGHGACAMAGGRVTCTCARGWAGDACGACDAATGYHDDGADGCTADPCLPNPCRAANRSVCAPAAGGVACACDRGHHLTATGCVRDEACAPATCNGHGACTVVDGVARCACARGWAGAACGACDVAMGYHDDGAGGCTADPCLPNPCRTPRRTVCTPAGAAVSCACDPGYHLDGMGGCTDDPCAPDPCAARGLACRAMGTSPQCYMPTCSDSNPCTDDAFVGGRCVYTPRADGSACATTACVRGQTCAAGACAGGTALRCDDGNPCTADSCDDAAGCRNVRDDRLVPDDGRACTVDVCAGGAARNTPDHARCDDGRWCTGTELCQPAAVGADARGCVATGVPAPPPPTGSPCATYGACDEVTRAFPLQTRPAGSACDDGLPCTAEDACTASGACAGRAVASCPPAACVTMGPLPARVDIPSASVTGRVTLRGGAFPTTAGGGTTNAGLYLVARDTGVPHQFGGAYFDSFAGRWTTSLATRLVPGVYDLLYSASYDTTYNQVSGGAATATIPYGRRKLRTDVVIGPGINTLDVDIVAGTVSGRITLRGGAFPTTAGGGTTNAGLYLVARDTGVPHQIGGAYFDSFAGRWTTSLATTLPPGVYDLLYSASYDTTYRQVSGGAATGTIPYGRRILRTDITLTAGANTLDVDLTSVSVTGRITLNGGAFPTTAGGGTTNAGLYLVARDTGVPHQLGGAYFDSFAGRWTTSLATTLPPGVYDLLYSASYDTTYRQVSGGSATATIPYGRRLLRRDITIGPGATTLDVDLVPASVTGRITLRGGAFPTTAGGGTTNATLYLVARDTGVPHQLGGAYFDSFAGRWTTSLATTLPPGVYDLLYSASYDTTYNQVSGGAATATIPYGRRILRTDITLTAGANTLDVDLTSVSVTGRITLNGGAFPTTAGGGTTNATLYLVARDTGVPHQLGGAYFDSFAGRWTTSLATRLVPGVYDLLYSASYDTTYNQVSGGAATATIPYGRRILRQGIVVGPADTTLDVDLAPAALTRELTVNGGAFPTTAGGGTTNATLYLVARDTGVPHQVGGAYFDSFTGRWTTSFASSLVPGVYDLMYSASYDTTYRQVSGGSATSTLPYGRRLLGLCVSVP